MMVNDSSIFAVLKWIINNKLKNEFIPNYSCSITRILTLLDTVIKYYNFSYRFELILNQCKRVNYVMMRDVPKL